MKITADMVGKKVRREEWGSLSWVRVEWTRDGHVAGVDESGRPYALDIVTDDWELAPEPPKKPSERIRELRRELAGDPLSINRADVRAEAVVRYLDELREQGKI
jgi:hypothetical protein